MFWDNSSHYYNFHSALRIHGSFHLLSGILVNRMTPSQRLVLWCYIYFFSFPFSLYMEARGLWIWESAFGWAIRRSKKVFSCCHWIYIVWKFYKKVIFIWIIVNLSKYTFSFHLTTIFLFGQKKTKWKCMESAQKLNIR